MKEQVILKVRVFREAPRADVTFEGPRTAVDVHVRPEVSGGGERFAAEIAFVGFVLEQNRTVEVKSLPTSTD